MPNLDDTQPIRRVEKQYDYGGLAAPPKILLWGVIGLFVLGIVGVISGIVVFREVLTPGQQVRVIGYAPFMEAFLPPRPEAGDTLPASTNADSDAAQGLLNLNLGGETAGAAPEATPEITSEPTAEPTQAITEEAAAEATEAVALAPTATPTLAPTATPTTAPPTQTPLPTATTAPEDVLLSTSRNWEPSALNTGFTRYQQTWNNCGPANITMALSYYGWERGQEYAASYLKPFREDKNVSPHELVSFVEEQTQINALWRMGGDLDMLRTLVDNGFPVIIERSIMFEGYDWTGHYQTVVGYNDTAELFYIYDSFLPSEDPENPSISESYAELDEHWREFNRIFIVVYTPGQETRLMNLLGELENPLTAAEHAYDVAQAEARANQNDAFAWFNMGTSLTKLERYEEAAVAFDEAFSKRTLPWRMLWYQFAPFEAYYAVGRYDDVLNYVNNNLSNGGQYVEETYYWQGRALAAQGDSGGAAVAFRNAISRNRLYEDAAQALENLN